MRQIELRAAWGEAFGSAPVEMRCEGLAYGFVVVQHPDLLADELHRPHAECVRSCARPADVAEQADGHERVSGDRADASLCLGFHQVRCPVSARCDGAIAALPHPFVLFGVFGQAVLPLPLQLGGKLGVVAPVELNDLRQRVLALPEAALDGGRFPVRVPCDPQFSVPVLALFPQRRNQHVPCAIGDWLGLVNPAQQDAPFGLDRSNVAIKTSKGERNPPVFAFDVLVAQLVVAQQPGFVLNRSLDFL